MLQYFPLVKYINMTKFSSSALGDRPQVEGVLTVAVGLLAASN